MSEILTDEQVADIERIWFPLADKDGYGIILRKLVERIRHVQAEVEYWKGHEVIQILNDEVGKAKQENAALKAENERLLVQMGRTIDHATKELKEENARLRGVNEKMERRQQALYNENQALRQALATEGESHPVEQAESNTEQ